MTAPSAAEANTDNETHTAATPSQAWRRDATKTEYEEVPLGPRAPKIRDGGYDPMMPRENTSRPLPGRAWSHTEAADDQRNEHPNSTDRPSPTNAPPIPPWVAHQRRAVMARNEAQETAPASQPNAASDQPRLIWLWTALAGALLGGLLGVGLSVVAFVILNGALDVNRSRAVEDLRAQLAGLSTELDAVRTDTSALQGTLGQLEQDVDTLADLPERVDQAEGALETVTGDITTLQEEDAALQGSLDTLDARTGELETGLETVQGQTRRANGFFQQLRDLMNDTFGEGP